MVFSTTESNNDANRVNNTAENTMEIENLSSQNTIKNEVSRTENTMETKAVSIDVDTVNNNGVTRMSFYKKPTLSKFDIKLNQLRKNNYKPVILKDQQQLIEWWKWISRTCDTIGLFNACKKLIDAKNEQPPRYIICRDDEDKIIKKLIRESVPEISIYYGFEDTAQECLYMCINGMLSDPFQYARNLRDNFNFNDSKRREVLIQEWKDIDLRFELQGLNINESKVITNLIAYVETNNLGEELKNNIIKLDRNDPMIIINAIHAYYDWKEERFRNDVVNSKRNKTDNNNNSRYEDVVN